MLARDPNVPHCYLLIARGYASQSKLNANPPIFTPGQALLPSVVPAPDPSQEPTGTTAGAELVSVSPPTPNNGHNRLVGTGSAQREVRVRPAPGHKHSKEKYRMLLAFRSGSKIRGIDEILDLGLPCTECALGKWFAESAKCPTNCEMCEGDEEYRTSDGELCPGRFSTEVMINLRDDELHTKAVELNINPKTCPNCDNEGKGRRWVLFDSLKMAAEAAKRCLGRKNKGKLKIVKSIMTTFRKRSRHNPGKPCTLWMHKPKWFDRRKDWEYRSHPEALCLQFMDADPKIIRELKAKKLVRESTKKCTDVQCGWVGPKPDDNVCPRCKKPVKEDDLVEKERTNEREIRKREARIGMKPDGYKENSEKTRSGASV